jgi:dienelactone hydrolase
VSSQEALLSNLTPDLIDETMRAAGEDRLTPVPCGVRNILFRYTTQDRGKPVEATGILGIPLCQDDLAYRPVIVWLHGTTGFMDKCAPSASAFDGPAQTTVISSQGYVSVAPDYIGMLGFGEPSPEGSIHAYLVGEAAAVGAWDAVRAALAFLAGDPELPDGDPDSISLWGASQGGHAAFFTQLYQPYYAPEFTVRLVVAGVPAVSVLGEAKAALTTYGEGSQALAAALVAMAAWYGAMDRLGEVFTNQAPTFLVENLPGAMAVGCEAAKTFDAVEELADAYVPTFIDKASQGLFEQLAPWGCFLAENSVPTASIQPLKDVPFLTTFGENDQLVNTAVELDAVQALCAQGYRIEQVLCAGAGHAQGGVQPLPYMFDWTRDRLEGKSWPESAICAKPVPQDCTRL